MNPPSVRLPYLDRHEAGRVLASCLRELKDIHPDLILGLPRGGVPVAYEVARAFDLPLDVWLVRKLGVPMRKEVAMGAIATGGVTVWNDDVLSHLRNPEQEIEEVRKLELAELQRREKYYRMGRDPVSVQGKQVLLVDDGLATGATMRAAVKSVRQSGARGVLVAAPVGSLEARAMLEREVDAVRFAATPENFQGVGQFYQDFTQTEDEEVKALLLERVMNFEKVLYKG